MSTGEPVLLTVRPSGPRAISGPASGETGKVKREAFVAIQVVLMGLGAIGRLIARAALAKPELEIVAALDLDQARVGRKLGDVIDAPAPDVVITADANLALGRGKGGILLHATGSRLDRAAGERLDRVEGERAQALTAGLSVISTCEELSYPWLRHPEIAERLDRIADKRKVSLLGPGVNPGFVLDRLPATLGSVVGRVDRVNALRIVDARTRRLQLQRKIGAGMNEEEFDRGVDDGTVGHIGLMESAALAALGVGLEVDEVDESIDPVEADEDVSGEGFTVPKGGIVGVHQVARAFHDGKEIAHLELTIALGAPDPGDEIELVGDPGLKCVIPGGVPGDRATAWSVVHAAPLVSGAEPGLITVLDLPAGRGGAAQGTATRLDGNRSRPSTRSKKAASAASPRPSASRTPSISRKPPPAPRDTAAWSRRRLSPPRSAPEAICARACCSLPASTPCKPSRASNTRGRSWPATSSRCAARSSRSRSGRRRAASRTWW